MCVFVCVCVCLCVCVYAGTLASVRSDADTTRINQLSCVWDSGKTWVGGYRKGSSFVWLSSGRVQEETVIWGSGKDGNTYTHWGSGQPDNSGGKENCLDLFEGTYTVLGVSYTDRRYKWNDESCAIKLKAVVEF